MLNILVLFSSHVTMTFKLKNPGWITEEGDFDFVLIVGGIFLSISMLFYFCDSTFRTSFGFDGGDAILEDTCQNNDIV